MTLYSALCVLYFALSILYLNFQPTVWAGIMVLRSGRLFVCRKGESVLTGRIHSFESMGLVDGPGIRSVIFMQGCALRCLYCHNPDTWERESADRAKEMTAEELVKKVSRFRTYFDASGGGVTVSGGEPLLQAGFVAEFFRKCHEAGIRTCLDTAGFGNGDYDRVLSDTDLVLYDIKHYIPEKYREITGQDIRVTEQFLDAVQGKNIPVWIRHVAVPDLTDSSEHIKGLAEYIRGIRNVQRVEILPYHLLGVNKYKELGISYRLEGTVAMDFETADKLQKEMEKWLK